MGTVLGKEKTSLNQMKTEAACVPHHDVCRLSYYLHCVTVACGFDIIVDELVDYRNAHRLPVKRQDAIFSLAYQTFGLEALSGKTIFLDNDRKILKRGNNNFYDLEKVTEIIAVQRTAVIGGEHKEVRKIMVCNRAWLDKYYIGPLQRNLRRLERIRGEQQRLIGETLAAELLLAALCLAASESPRND